MTDRREQAALLALTEAAATGEEAVQWHDIAHLIEAARSASSVADGSATFYDEHDAQTARALAARISPQMTTAWAESLELALGDGVTSLVTILDDAYPANLRRVFNRPPFLFVTGALAASDDLAVAIVGARQPSPEGRAHAGQLAFELARRGVTVVSGLARGIDTEAHTAALDAGGRTIAVMGTGIERVYPDENRALADRISAQGALVSQFWPGTSPRRENFPLRNVVSSGLAMGTIVVEAASTSGARMQARLALEHGKRLFLVAQLVVSEDWAKRYAERPGATVVKSVDDIVTVLAAERTAQQADQLSLL